MVLLLANDTFLLRDITTFYCAVTIVFTSLLLAGLILSGHFLLFGSLSILPVFILLSLFEFVKWFYMKYLIFKDNNPVHRNNNDFFIFSTNLLQTFSLSELIKCLFTFVGCIIFSFIISVLFGAELLDGHEQTFMFSLLMALLSAYPLCLNMGSASVTQLVNVKKPKNVLHELLYRNIQGAVVGAWFGAFVIPLDWDRPWQAWPVPCSTGALLGYTLSHYCMLLFVYFSNNVKNNAKLSRKKH